ncbi:hypothetical protein JCM10213_002738, partial [Rhodosporidiobolus nylandii]
NPSNPNNRLGRTGGGGGGNGRGGRGNGGGNGGGRSRIAAAAAQDDGDLSDGVTHLSIAATTVKPGFSHSPEAWFVDSCATRSIAHDRASFSAYEKLDESISTAAGDEMKVIGKGNVELTVVVSGKEEKLTLTGVYHVPSSSFNLLSLPRVQKAGFECIFRPD